MLYHKRILLIVSGSIAAYKSPDIVRRAKEAGSEIKVILTTGGAQFITKMSLETVGGEVYTDYKQSDMPHIGLAKWADIVLIAPASVNMIAKITNGMAEDLASLTILSTQAEIFIAPAMNKEMLANTATTDNLALLEQRGIRVLPTGNGEQACGDVGYGRMLEPVDIINSITKIFNTSMLSGKKVVLTVGATLEYIDPVRYISNYSSGKMGVALGYECISRGLDTTIIYGEVKVELPTNSRNIHALSTKEMQKAVDEHIVNADIFIAVAAVSDYKITNPTIQKIKKTADTLNLEFIKNSDILASVSKRYPHIFTIGFCAETDDLQRYAKEKLQSKNLDMIVANYIKDGFGSDTNSVIIMDSNNTHTVEDSKTRIATTILDIVEHNYD